MRVIIPKNKIGTNYCLWMKDFMYIITDPHDLKNRYDFHFTNYFHFTNEEMELQKAPIISPRLHS